MPANPSRRADFTDPNVPMQLIARWQPQPPGLTFATAAQLSNPFHQHADYAHNCTPHAFSAQSQTQRTINVILHLMHNRRINSKTITARLLHTHPLTLIKTHNDAISTNHTKPHITGFVDEARHRHIARKNAYVQR